MQTLRLLVLGCFLLLGTMPAQGRVFLQWTEPAIPPATEIGARDVVVPWAPGNIQLMKTARERGYRVFAEVNAANAVAAADAAAASALAGIIVERDSNVPGQGQVGALIVRLRKSRPGLSILELDPGGKQPQIRGGMVVKRNGVLAVSSPTQQPWVDSNVALARFEQAYQTGQPPLYSFRWDLTDPLEQQIGPRAADYELAVAEAGAMRSDVILPIHPNLQKALAKWEKDAWREWNRVKNYLRFYSDQGGQSSDPLADVALIANNYDDTYEAMNLLSRHNILFHVLPPSDVAAQRLARFQLVVMFARPAASAAHALQEFSSAGGTVILVAQHGPCPWDSLPAVKTSDGSRYQVGRGVILELSGPVGDPDAFAVQVRDLLHRQGSLIYLWNAVTTLGFVYKAPQAGGLTLDLVNYAQEPLQVQVRIKGSFPNIRYETPAHGFYPAVTPDLENGFTQFVVPHLEIGARVYLDFQSEQPQ